MNDMYWIEWFQFAEKLKHSLIGGECLPTRIKLWLKLGIVSNLQRRTNQTETLQHTTHVEYLIRLKFSLFAVMHTMLAVMFSLVKSMEEPPSAEIHTNGSPVMPIFEPARNTSPKPIQ